MQNVTDQSVSISTSCYLLLVTSLSVLVAVMCAHCPQRWWVVCLYMSSTYRSKLYVDEISPKATPKIFFLLTRFSRLATYFEIVVKCKCALDRNTYCKNENCSLDIGVHDCVKKTVYLVDFCIVVLSIFHNL